MKHHFLRAAQKEISTAFEYYEGQGAGIGQDFLEAMDAAIRLLCAYPESGRSLDDGCRKFLVRGYPYALVYKIRDGVVVLVAVMHQHRKPDYWNKRI